MSPQFGQILHSVAERERHYVSNHTYSLENMGLTREHLVSVFRDIFERFDFDTREDSTQASALQRVAPARALERQ